MAKVSHAIVRAENSDQASGREFDFHCNTAHGLLLQRKRLAFNRAQRLPAKDGLRHLVPSFSFAASAHGVFGNSRKMRSNCRFACSRWVSSKYALPASKK